MLAGSISLIALVVLITGCGSKSDEVSSTPASGNVSLGEPTAPAEVQPQQLQLPKGADQQAILDELNREVKKWVMRNRRKPASFEEVVSTAQLQVPPPPPGKKYVLNSELKVKLENE